MRACPPTLTDAISVILEGVFVNSVSRLARTVVLGILVRGGALKIGEMMWVVVERKRE